MFLRPLTLSLAALTLTACATADTPAKPVSPPTTDTKQPKVALVLGGGGTRGFAHIGVIEALEASGIKPDIVVGTSVGAIVGAIYASGQTPAELVSLSQTLKDSDVIEITPSKQGFVSGERLRSYVNNQTAHKPIENFPMRFAAVATEMQTKQPVSFQAGEAGIAVQASSSVPNIFIAPRIPENGGKKYIDGSASALLPARIARSLGADVVISVDVMANADAPTTDQKTKQASAPTHATNVQIERNEAGVSARWGDQHVSIPINAAELDKISQQLPVDLPLGTMFGQILAKLPASTNIAIPEEMQQVLASPQSVFQKLGQIGSNVRANPDDIAASSVVIRPDLANVAVYDATDRKRVIELGRTATLAEIDNIKQAITTAQYQYAGKMQ